MPDETAVAACPGPGARVRPPNRREIFTELLEDAATGWWKLSASFGDDGLCQEIFLTTAHRAGSAFDALVHDACIVISRDCLQRGLSARDLVRNLSDQPPSLYAKALSICAAHEAELRMEVAGAAQH